MSPSFADERLQALARDDKWFLSCGDGVIWAPPFPRSLHRPGFWDEALVYEHPFEPLFTIALIDPDADEIELHPRERAWRPDTLRVVWHAARRPELIEERFALPGGRLGSRWRRADGRGWGAGRLRGCHLVAFSLQPGDSTTDVERVDSTPGLCWRRALTGRRDARLDAHATLTLDADMSGGTPGGPRIGARRTEGHYADPRWTSTPFWEQWRGTEPTADDLDLRGISPDGFICMAVAVPCDMVHGDTIEFTIRLEPCDGARRQATRPPTPSTEGDREPAIAWRRFFEQFPRFTCSDPHLTRYFDYRLYGLRLNRLEPYGNVHHPAVAEGIDYFHVPISYSAQCHMWETRWARDPELAHGSLLNFLELQRADGSFHGRLYSNHLTGTDFYHANWGDAVLAVDAVHRDEQFLERAYDGLSRYAHWLDRTRDREGSGMYDVVNQFETGQEYMSRYQVVDDAADRAGWAGDMRLKGIDVTVYAYQLKRALARVAERLGRAGDVEEWRHGMTSVGTALTHGMWSEEIGLFSDVDPRTTEPTGVRAAVCFYPLLTDLLTEDVLQRLLAHLEDPSEFATPYPVPSSSVSDPSFSAHAQWKGKRHNCPWNGRAWPMINSHILEGLLRQWHGGRRTVGPVAARLLVRFVRMLFHDGDVGRPNCYEHYHPFTGQPSVYRGIDDYQHSWVLDLIVRGVAGLEPRCSGILIDPLPCEVAQLTLERATVRGHTVSITRDGDDVVVVLDGARHTTSVGTPLELSYA
jgi:hypothetical protein